MSFLKKVFALLIVLALVFAGFVVYWAQQPIIPQEQPGIDFSIKPGSPVKSAAQQIAAAGVPMNSQLFVLLARMSGKSAKMKAGNYVLKPGATPLHLIYQLVRGEFAQESISIIEGWTFKQMREEVNSHPALKHDTAQMSDQELLARITADFKSPEGLFFPDTYMFATGASDLQIYKQAHAVLMKRLNESWAARNPSLPYKTSYEALTMASIVEKETGQSSERNMVAAVFVNRLKLGMLLQTDPTVIYGMGDKYKGKIHKSDLERDTPYNTYTRAGLPPTPIALPGAAALAATLNPATADVLYFVARKDGSSEFSSNLSDHNRAVNKYQR
ncbi:MAG: endolytic transglycosylase MltG [Burkholderiaceae bacterium]